MVTKGLFFLIVETFPCFLVLGCNRQAQEIHYLAVSDDMGHKSSNKREPEVETIDKFPRVIAGGW